MGEDKIMCVLFLHDVMDINCNVMSQHQRPLYLPSLLYVDVIVVSVDQYSVLWVPVRSLFCSLSVPAGCALHLSLYSQNVGL